MLSSLQTHLVAGQLAKWVKDLLHVHEDLRAGCRQPRKKLGIVVRDPVSKTNVEV